MGRSCVAEVGSQKSRERNTGEDTDSGIKPGVVAGSCDPSSGEVETASLTYLEGSRPWRDFVSKDQVDCA